MKNKLVLLIGLCSIFIMSCSVEPQKIEYGKDACSFCKMTIVETKFAAEIVTKKGRAFKYDATECLINDIENKDESSLAFILVTDYNTPKELINATEATFLISKEIKSPMGAYLSAYKTNEEAKKNGTKIFNWQSLKKHFSN